MGVWVRVLATAAAAVVVSGNIAQRTLLEDLEVIDAFVRADDAADRAETDGIVGMEANSLRILEADQKAFTAECKATENDAIANEGRVAASGAMRDALVEESGYLEDALASYGNDCIQSQESRGHRVVAVKARRTIVSDLLAQIEKSKVDSFENDPCALGPGLMGKDQCNSCLIHDQLHCSQCVYDEDRNRCFSAAAASGTKAMVVDNIETTIAQLRNLTITLDGFIADAIREAAVEPIACAAEQDQRMLLSVVNATLNELDRNVVEWRDAADYKRRQLIAAELITAAKATAVANARLRVEKAADAYQTRRNARVSTMLCDTFFLRQALTSGEPGAATDSQMRLLPGPAQYPGTTLPANGLDKCEARTAQNEEAILTTPASRPPIQYRGGKGFANNWAQQPKHAHVEPMRVIDVEG